jgi:hypothetical protein
MLISEYLNSTKKKTKNEEHNNINLEFAYGYLGFCLRRFVIVRPHTGEASSGAKSQIENPK